MWVVDYSTHASEETHENVEATWPVHREGYPNAACVPAPAPQRPSLCATPSAMTPSHLPYLPPTTSRDLRGRYEAARVEMVFFNAFLQAWRAEQWGAPRRRAAAATAPGLAGPRIFILWPRHTPSV